MLAAVDLQSSDLKPMKLKKNTSVVHAPTKAQSNLISKIEISAKKKSYAPIKAKEK